MFVWTISQLSSIDCSRDRLSKAETVSSVRHSVTRVQLGMGVFLKSNQHIFGPGGPSRKSYISHRHQDRLPWSAPMPTNFLIVGIQHILAELLHLINRWG